MALLMDQRGSVLRTEFGELWREKCTRALDLFIYTGQNQNQFLYEQREHDLQSKKSH